MRAFYDSLFKKAKVVFEKDPFSGHLFLFVNRKRSSIKCLYYDGTGFVIIAKRLERGLFSRINPFYTKEVVLTEAEFSLFFEGANLEKRLGLSQITHKKSYYGQPKVFYYSGWHSNRLSLLYDCNCDSRQCHNYWRRGICEQSAHFRCDSRQCHNYWRRGILMAIRCQSASLPVLDLTLALVRRRAAAGPLTRAHGFTALFSKGPKISSLFGCRPQAPRTAM